MFFLRQSPTVAPLVSFDFDLDGTPVIITPRRHATARRMVLRATRDGQGFALTLPKRHSQRAIAEFLRSSSDWMLGQLAKQDERLPLSEGSTLLLRGETYALQATGKLRGTIAIDLDAKCISLPGAPDHLQRRLQDWLKSEALADLRRASSHYAEAMSVSFKRISVRDQKSRWGSCTTEGTLSYSWRLVMAPAFVLDYVAAHEVAHLREMNHGPRFWRLVLNHCKDTRRAKAWLKQNGNMLHRAI
jgi:predicted metal-dependent hydrolase